MKFTPNTPCTRLARYALVLLSLGAIPMVTEAQTFIANEDTFISNASSGTNYGTNLTLSVSGRGISYARKSYIGFDLSGVDSATSFGAASSFNITTSADPLIGSANGSVVIDVYGMNDNTAQFSETAITWNNAPKNDVSSSSGFWTTGVVFLGSVTINSSDSPGNTTVSLSGQALANYMNWAVGNLGDYYGTGATQANGKKITLMLATDQEYVGTSYPGFYFYSSRASVEDSLKPVLNGVAVPEPATFGLWGGGLILGLAIIGRRRR